MLKQKQKQKKKKKQMLERILTLSPLVATLIVCGQNVGPDLDPNCLTLWWYSLKDKKKTKQKKKNKIK